MAYQNPVFYLWHDFAEATAVVESGGSTSGDVANLYDYRTGELIKWPSEASPNWDGCWSNPRAQVNAAGVYQSIDTLIVPAGSVFSGTCNVRVIFDFDTTWVNSPVYPLAFTSIDETLQVFTLAPAGTPARGYGLVQIERTTTSTIEVGEFYLTEARTMSRGPDPGWDISSRSHSNQMTSMAGVDSSRITGASVKTFRMRWNSLSGTDLDIIDDLLTLCGTARPFYFKPPDDRYPEVMLVKLSRDPQIRQQRANPSASGPAYEVQLDLIEVTG